MRKLKSFLCFIFIMTMYCQIGLSQSTPTSMLKYRSITIGIGPRVLNTDPGTILTSFIDDSPSMDNLSTTTSVKDSYTRIGVFFAFNFGRYKGLSHSIAVDYTLGKHQGGVFYYSLGYSFPIEIKGNPLVIRPAINAGFGNYGFDVGELQNNASYIQIGDVQYYDASLDLYLKSQTFIYGPAIDFHYILPNQIKVFANMGYDIASKNSRPYLEFNPPSNSESGTSSLEIDGDNPNVTFNGTKMTSLPYEASGLRFTVGVGYVWTKH